MEESRKVIYVAGHPRSGTTWLTRLLGSYLNCPTGAFAPEYDAVEPATEGWSRPGGYVVRKGHFRLHHGRPGKVILGGHTLAYKELTDEKVIWIVRDPRDVAVSAQHYWNQPSLKAAIENNMAEWGPQIRDWLEADFSYFKVHYEDLWADTVSELCWIVQWLGQEVNIVRAKRAARKQSFLVRRRFAHMYGDKLPLGREYHIRFLRRGEPGAWKEHFDTETRALAYKCFGEMAQRLGYELA